MRKLKISVIGAGSSYTPELFEKLAELSESLPVREISLMDIDGKRLEIMEGFCKRYSAHLKYDVTITGTTNRLESITGADFIIIQLRVGGNAARVNDEKIPMKYDQVGQETTGAGGMMKAFRTIPVLLDIAGDVEKYCPNAWIINYTNPTGLVTEAVTKFTNVKIAGLCAGGLAPKYYANMALGVKHSSVRYDYVGLNHMNFAFNVTIDGKPLTDEQFDKISEKVWNIDADFIKKLRLLPSSYLQYFFHTGKKVKAMKEAPYTRGEEVQMLEKEVFQAYSDVNLNTKPSALAKRGGGGYSDVAIGIMNAIYNDTDTWMVINVPNNGTIKTLPDDAVIETGCLVNNSGIHPLSIKEVPSTVWGIISAVKNYEQLAVEAAVQGDWDLALMALMAHPLIREYDIAKPLLDELMEANKDFLPQFYK
jgi:6-phospho-beta-glucosidase